MKRTLIVNADDFGLTDGVCEGILRAGEHGIVTSTSALAVAPAFARHVIALRDSGLGVGGHLCAVGEDPPILSAGEIPTLVDRSGRFPMTWRTFLRREATGRVDPADLRREFTAQLALLRDSGISLTHLDTHQNLHLWPTVGAAVVEIATAHGIGAIRVPRTRRRSPRGLAVSRLGRRLGERASGAGLQFPDASRGLDEAGTLDTEAILSAITSLAATRVGDSVAASMELATHPGTADDPDRVRYDWGYRWPAELEGLCASSTRAQVERLDLALGTFADLAVRR